MEYWGGILTSSNSARGCRESGTDHIIPVWALPPIVPTASRGASGRMSNFESRALFLFRLDRFPGCVRVETLHLFECVEGSWPKVLVIDHAVVADDKGPRTR